MKNELTIKQVNAISAQNELVKAAIVSLADKFDRWDANLDELELCILLQSHSLEPTLGDLDAWEERRDFIGDCFSNNFDLTTKVYESWKAYLASGNDTWHKGRLARVVPLNRNVVSAALALSAVKESTGIWRGVKRWINHLATVCEYVNTNREFNLDGGPLLKFYNNANDNKSKYFTLLTPLEIYKSISYLRSAWPEIKCYILEYPLDDLTRVVEITDTVNRARFLKINNSKILISRF